jgi:lauroyl/myristoyl acyltransferase
VSAPPQLTGGSTLELCPFVVKGKGDHYTVINREGRQAISTSKAGVEAIRLLRQGSTVEEARRALGRRYGHPAEQIDLGPLLDTLFSAGWVRSMDGRQVSTGDAPPRRDWRLWLTLFAWSPLLELALKHLPLRLALPLAYRWLAQRSSPDLERRIAANLRRAPHLVGTDRGMARIAAANCEALRKQFCDRLVLGSLSPRRGRRWLTRTMRVSGLEHLARAGAARRGIILCSFHLGSYGLIPFALAARGVAVTVYAGFGDEYRADVAAWLAGRARRGDPYPVRIVGGGMGLRELARCLERGETVLLYCDQVPGVEGNSPSARGWIRVPFLGTRIWGPRGLGWLRRRTGAAVLPVALLWEGRAGHHLRIDPALACRGASESTDIDAVVTEAYGALERYVRRDPAQWLRWPDFDGMVLA